MGLCTFTFPRNTAIKAHGLLPGYTVNGWYGVLAPGGTPRANIERLNAEIAKFLAFGKPYRVVDPGHAIKLFPSQYATHFAITAGLDMHAKIGDARHIRRVQIRGPVMNYIDRPKPVSSLDGKFSLQYTTAAALLDGSVKIDTFTGQRRFRADMVAMLGKIKLTQDAAIPHDLHDMRIELTVTMADGVIHYVVCKGPKGTWGMPPLRDEDHLVKLKDCFSRALSAVQMDEALARLAHIERLSADGVRSLLRLFAGKPRVIRGRVK